jgi:hypothetical protein
MLLAVCFRVRLWAKTAKRNRETKRNETNVSNEKEREYIPGLLEDFGFAGLRESGAKRGGDNRVCGSPRGRVRDGQAFAGVSPPGTRCRDS